MKQVFDLTLQAETEAESGKDVISEEQKNLSESDDNRVRGEVDAEAPGASAFLSDYYNIEHFARYPKEVLVEMSRSRDDAGPWGLIIVAKADHNGAFYSPENLAKLKNQVGGSFKMRIVEAGTVEEAQELTAKLTRAHGRAGYCMIGGHGSSVSIQFGEAPATAPTGPEQELTYKLTAQKEGEDKQADSGPRPRASLATLGETLDSNLEERAGIVLFSCSTAADPNKQADSTPAADPDTTANELPSEAQPIADQLAKVAKREVYGANDSVHGVSDFNPTTDGRSVKFNPEFKGAGTRKIAA